MEISLLVLVVGCTLPLGNIQASQSKQQEFNFDPEVTSKFNFSMLRRIDSTEKRAYFNQSFLICIKNLTVLHSFEN